MDLDKHGTLDTSTLLRVSRQRLGDIGIETSHASKYKERNSDEHSRTPISNGTEDHYLPNRPFSPKKTLASKARSKSVVPWRQGLQKEHGYRKEKFQGIKTQEFDSTKAKKSSYL